MNLADECVQLYEKYGKSKDDARKHKMSRKHEKEQSQLNAFIEHEFNRSIKKARKRSVKGFRFTIIELDTVVYSMTVQKLTSNGFSVIPISCDTLLALRKIKIEW